jgi:hypothetical protein
MYDNITNKRLKEFICKLKINNKNTLYRYISQQINIGKHYSYNDFIKEVKDTDLLENLLSPEDFISLNKSIDKFNEYLMNL